MKLLTRIYPSCLALMIFTSCSLITYTPRSKKNIHREQPSMLLLDGIVDFRIEQMGWPTSKEDFMSKGLKYWNAFQGFPYNYTKFTRIDSNKMIFYFSDHIKDVENFKQTEKVDLNSYHGRVTFYKEDGKFIWELKMK